MKVLSLYDAKFKQRNFTFFQFNLFHPKESSQLRQKMLLADFIFIEIFLANFQGYK